MAYFCGIDMKHLCPLVFLLCFFCQTTQGRKRNRAQSRPNIIFILTDDQDSELGSMWVMNKTRRIFSSGADFVNAFVTSPICCPSRSSILTGMYAHNHNTLTNNVNCSSPNWRAGPERKSYAKYLADSGYLTGHFGKYLNEYDGSYIPAGWHRWVGLIRNSRFYNYTLRHNTFFKRHSNVYRRDYFTDVITNHSLAFFRHAKARNPDRPILMVISHSAPHGPEDGAPQYQRKFENITSPRLPNWNFVSPDKHWIVRVTPEMTKQKTAFSDLLYRKRLQTLLSVDDSIQRVYNMLKATGQLDDTYIFFSSDHGYHLGQYGLVKGKSMPYESDIRVPMYAIGPNIPRNIKMHQVVLNIDLAPTFLDIAGIKAPRSMDGVSIMKLFRRLKSQDDKPRVRRKISHMWRDTFLIERGKPKKYPRPKVAKKPKKSTKATFLEKICLKTKYRSPCVLGQQWQCVRINGQQRLRKCKKVGQQFVPSTSAPTPEMEMCTCYRPKFPWTAGKSSPNEQPYGDDWESYLRSNEVGLARQRRRFRRSAQRALFKEKQMMRELARAMKQQARRNKAKMLERENKRAQEEQDASNPGFDVDGKLQRLNARIAGIKNRLEMLRGRKKKLIRIKEEKETVKNFKEKYEEFPCPCPIPSRSTIKKSKRPRRSQRRGRLLERLRSGMIPPDVYRRKMNKKMMKRSGLRSGLRKAFSGKRKKKTAKKSSRRSKCAVPGLNCFHQTNYHWKTAPLWKGGEFCFCPSSSNNTFWCLRTINQHQNFLYCEFVTQFLEYFDLNADPYQLYNIVDRISPSVLYDLHNQLEYMKRCKGAHSCTQYHGKPRPTTIAPTPFLNATEEPVMSSMEPTTGQESPTEKQEIATLPRSTTTASSKDAEGPTESSDIEQGVSESKNETKNEREEMEIKKREKGMRKKKGNKKESPVDKDKIEKKKRRKKKRNGKALKNVNERNKNGNGNENPPTELTPTTVAPTLKVEKEKRNQRRKKKIRSGISKEQKQLRKREKNRNKNKGKASNRRKGAGSSSSLDSSLASTSTAPTTSQAREENNQKDEQESDRYEEEIPQEDEAVIRETANL